MGEFFNGMLAYEIILLILGVILFIILVIGLMQKLKHNDLKTIYVASFFLPIVMIAYPSVKSVSFSNGLIKFEKLVSKAEENPQDPEILNKLREEVNNNSEMPIRSEKQLIAQAKANTILKNYNVAEQKVQLLQQENPQEAQIISSRIAVLKAQDQLAKDSTDISAREIQFKNLKVLETQSTPTTFDKNLITKARRDSISIHRN